MMKKQAVSKDLDSTKSNTQKTKDSTSHPKVHRSRSIEPKGSQIFRSRSTEPKVVAEHSKIANAIPVHLQSHKFDVNGSKEKVASDNTTIIHAPKCESSQSLNAKTGKKNFVF